MAQNGMAATPVDQKDLANLIQQAELSMQVGMREIGPVTNALADAYAKAWEDDLMLHGSGHTDIGLGTLLNVSPEIPITAEMIAAASAVAECFEYRWVPDDHLTAIYRAMAALAPPEVTAADWGRLENAARSLRMERDAAITMRNEAMAALTDMRSALDRAETELTTLRTRLAERDASVLKAARHRV